MNKTIIIILLLAFAGLAVWAYPTVKERYFEGEESDKKIEDEKESNEDETNEEEDDDENEDKKEEDEKEENDGEAVEQEESFLKIEREDCLNQCQDFEEEEEEEKLKYCRQVCGIEEPISEDSPEEESDSSEEESSCQEKSGLEKDYCLKNKAIEEENYSICEQIKDSGINETCKNTITEKIMDEQSLENF
ncbi:MAG: hypothetical protein ACOCUF_03685 [Patescibacteria group bacterium]